MTSPPRKHIERTMPPVRSKLSRMVHELAHGILHEEMQNQELRRQLKDQAESIMLLEGFDEIHREREESTPRAGLYWEQMIEGMTEDSKRQQARIKLLMETEDTLCMEANDIAANVCRLATAALSHLSRLQEGSTGNIDLDEYIEDTNGGHKQAAIALLKPLAGGMHETRPWQYNHLKGCGLNILNNDDYDPSMGDDPHNEWDTWPEWVKTKPYFSNDLIEKILNPPDDMPEVISEGNLLPDPNDNYETRTGDLKQHLKLAHGQPRPPYMQGMSAESMMMEEFLRRKPIFDRLDDPKPLPGEQGKSFVFNESKFNDYMVDYCEHGKTADEHCPQCAEDLKKDDAIHTVPWEEGLTCGLRYLVMDGDAFDGLTFYGPFNDVDAAIKWAEDNCTVNEWRTCPVNEVEMEHEEDRHV